MPEPAPAATHWVFSRPEWAALRGGASLTLSDAEVDELRSLNDRVSIADVLDVYLPLVRLLELHMAASRNTDRAVRAGFLGQEATPLPYVVGIAGSVAVGKSTIARLLRALLARLPSRPRVELVTTDGFLHPTGTLVERGLMQRKGFPESYDLRRMLAFLGALRSGAGNLQVPIYSHEAYDIVPDRFQLVDRPDILIFEGLNVLQTVSHVAAVASDYFDFSIYIDADPSSIEEWYVERFLLLQATAFQSPASYFHRVSRLGKAEATELARGIWRQTNLPNLTSNIQPTRARARAVIHKGPDHLVDEVRLRRT